MDSTLAGHYRCRRAIKIAAINAQRDEDQECDAHANRETIGKRGPVGWDSHEPGEPFVEFHSMSSFRMGRRRDVPPHFGSFQALRGRQYVV